MSFQPHDKLCHSAQNRQVFAEVYEYEHAK